MNGQMQFPEKWEDFVMENIITDHKQIYTNGLDLMPMDEVGNMMTHYLKIEQEKIDKLYKQVGTLIQEKPQWIPCSERLPEKTGTYLVTFDNGYRIGVSSLRYYAEIGGWSAVSRVTILAWMPLPEPYKESED